MITLIMPSANAASVPGRNCRNRSACWATSLKRGSMHRIFAPRFAVLLHPIPQKRLEAMVLRPP